VECLGAGVTLPRLSQFIFEWPVLYVLLFRAPGFRVF